MTMAMKIKEREEIVALETVISAIKVFRHKMNTEMLMEGFHLEEDQLTEILTLLDKYPDKDEWELAEMILYK